MDILEAGLKGLEMFINWVNGTYSGRDSETGVCGSLCAAGCDSGDSLVGVKVMLCVLHCCM